MYITRAFSGFSVNSLEKAKDFYTTVLGLEVEDTKMGLQLHLPNNGIVFIYQKNNHEPASFTILNFVVENIDKTAQELIEKGVQFERYEGMPQDETGILRGIAVGQGPDIAWFKDPSDNIISILQEA